MTSSEASASGNRARRYASSLVLVAIVVVVYRVSGLDGPFVFDDREAIVDNTSLVGGSWSELLWPLEDTPVAGRPVVNLSFAASRALSGLDPLAFRLFNLALHACTSLMLFALMRRTFRSSVLSDPIRAAAGGLAFSAALVWSVHPLLSETVFYVVQRSELWFGFFYVATLYGVSRSAESRLWTVPAVLACVLGALSKEAMVTAPILALLYDRTFVAGSFGEAWRRRKGLYFGLFATWAIVAAVLVAAPRAHSVGFHADRGLAGGGVDYLLAQGEMLPHYLRLFVLPWPLVFDYGTLRPVVVDTALVARLVGLVVLFGATCVWVVRRPVLGFVGAAFFVVLAPTSSFVPILTEIGAERRMYVPAMALTALVVAAAGRWVGGGRLLRSPRIGVVVVLPVVILLSNLTVARARDYATRVSIWASVVERRPQNARGHFNLGVALTDEGRVQESLAAYEQAVELRADYVEAHDNLGNTLAMLGRFDEALVHNRRASELSPSDARLLANLALTQFASGDPSSALPTIERALALDPSNADAHQTRALTLESLGRAPEAEVELREALRLAPNHAHAQLNLARLLAARGAPQAVPAAVRAAELAPTNVDARLQAARVLIAAGRGDAALVHVQASLQILQATGRGATVSAVAGELATQAEATGQPDIAARVRTLVGVGP